ncbi:phage regulatory CII family protein [Roseomonas xinghualingensis]|uniref:phage regulatory CII family protein n=1 Tax=Roseomonas xinghualingensis TaxID=2986475 RepID=UPI00298DAA21|nr:phage regulatory CII family protein [Roseomonas sp. SXEYE001]
MAFKTLARVLIEKAGGLEAAAACLRGRVGRSQLANYQSPHHDQFMPVDVAIRLTEVTGDIALIEAMAERAGYRLTPIGAVEPGCAVRSVAAVAKETNEALQALADGMGDGALCGRDVARIRSEMLDIARVATEGAASLGSASLHGLPTIGGAA